MINFSLSIINKLMGKDEALGLRTISYTKDISRFIKYYLYGVILCRK